MLPLALALLAACGSALAADDPAPPSPQQLLDASQPSDWRTPDPDDLLYMDLPAGRVVIELAPRFAPEHVANIRTLARGHYWDGLSVYR
jgi:peptidylprolyl isomerase